MAPVRTSTPSRRRAAATSSPTNGCSEASSRGATSTRVTVVPSRANAWPSSQPTAPPPSTSRRRGCSCVVSAWSLVQSASPRSSRPVTGGRTGLLPVATTRARDQRSCRSPTTSSPGPVTRPRPRTRVAPAAETPSAVPLSSRCSAAWSRRRTASAQSTPAPAASSRALLGMQATYGHSPPTRCSSTSATASPAPASPSATGWPPEPAPRTTTSYSSSGHGGPQSTGRTAPTGTPPPSSAAVCWSSSTGGLHAEGPQRGRHDRWPGPLTPVVDLEGDGAPVRQGGGVDALGAVLGDQPRDAGDQRGHVAPGAAEPLGVPADRGGHPVLGGARRSRSRPRRTPGPARSGRARTAARRSRRRRRPPTSRRPAARPSPRSDCCSGWPGSR